MAERILSPARRDRSDLQFRHALIGMSLVALVLGAVLGIALLAYPHMLGANFIAEPIPRFAAPELQPSPRTDMQAFRTRQLQQLDGAYWLDRPGGVVHLPIDLAMRKVASEGIADWPGRK